MKWIILFQGEIKKISLFLVAVYVVNSNIEEKVWLENKNNLIGKEKMPLFRVLLIQILHYFTVANFELLYLCSLFFLFSSIL